MEKVPDWTEGRNVVIRPDVPGASYDPANSALLSTEEERRLTEEVLDRHYDEVQKRGQAPG